MKKTAISTLILSFILVISVFAIKKPLDERHISKGYVSKSGFVPDQKTAVKIAEAVWYPIYGETVLRKKPYKAVLRKGVWIVEGSLPPNSQGGVPYIEIQKTDGKILKVSHGK